MLGHEGDCELVGRTIHELTAPEDREITRALNARGHAGEHRTFAYEKRYLRRDGSRLWVRVNVSVVRDEAGRFVRAIATAEDIAEERRAREALRRSEERLRAANEKLREADRRKDEFLGMLSHELRNPLAPIRNALYILDRAEGDGARARHAREVAARQVAHLTRLVDDLLDVTRIARGKIELRRRELDLGALVRRAADDHRALMQERRLDLAVHVPARPVSVLGDETRLAQVLGNLLHNAAKFTPAGGRVAVSLAAEDGAAVLRVRDTGAGIDPGMIATVFEPFTQAAQTLARSEGGLGLGLALVKGLVTLHGGAVTASSAGPGRGTEVAVTLPLAPARAAAPGGEEAAPAGAAAQPRRRVLVIDDNRDAADSLAELVSMFGHTAEVAYDGPAGLAKAAQGRPDVVLCDIGLPAMDGYEVARRLRARQRDVRLVAVSGYAQPDDVARAAEAGFDAHVAKPPDPDRLAALLGQEEPG
jgi:PAS domain S-box-containing protein